MLKCLHLSLSPSFTFTWNLNRKMSRKSWLTGNGNLSLPFAVNGNLNLSIVSRQTVTGSFKSHYFGWSSQTASSQRIVLTGTTSFHVPKYA